MSLRQKSVAVVSAFAMAGIGLVGFAAPATADSCPSGALCAWYNKNFDGDPGTVYGDNNNLLQYSKFANVGSTYNNGTRCNVALYSGRNMTGSKFTLARGDGININPRGAYADGIASNDWCV
ncbi:peptidase inhibitor family I36 protein [Actinopolyspora mortivallis]|nr:peptidase inhibitor family I36 protein [Actinopolyspora mortivallis]